MEAIERVFDAFQNLQPLNQTNSEQLKEAYTLLLQWATTYFDVIAIDPMDLWARMHQIKLDETPELWALIELCLDCIYGNSVCESFISYLRVVKTEWRNRLNESNLTDLMRIKVTGPALRGFSEQFCGIAVDLWNSEKVRRTQQGQRKKYAEEVQGQRRETWRGKSFWKLG